MESSAEAGSSVPVTVSDSRRRVHARVALVILETLRRQDLPSEILDDENLTLTLPRRLGLSDVIERQIRHLREEARRRRRLPDSEVLDLMQLVLRRPDARQVFREVGRELHGTSDGPGMRRFMPRSIALRLARRRVARFLKVLFGRTVVRAAGPGFHLEAGKGLPGRVETEGAICGLVSGLSEVALERYLADPPPVIHEALVDGPEGVCRWTVAEPDEGQSGNQSSPDGSGQPEDPDGSASDTETSERGS